MLHATETRNKLRPCGPLAHVHLYLYHLKENKVTSRYLIKDAKAAVACVKSISAKLKKEMKNNYNALKNTAVQSIIILLYTVE